MPSANRTHEFASDRGAARIAPDPPAYGGPPERGIRGAQLVTADYSEHEVEAERLDDGGLSTVSVRVCGLLTYAVLKIQAFQDRHDNKDAYDRRGAFPMRFRERF